MQSTRPRRIQQQLGDKQLFSQPKGSGIVVPPTSTSRALFKGREKEGEEGVAYAAAWVGFVHVLKDGEGDETLWSGEKLIL